MKQSKLLIFDFDGTIVDSKQVYYKSINNNLNKLGISSEKTDEAIQFGLNLRKTLRKLGFSFIYAFILKKKIMKDILKQVNKVKKCKDIDSIKNIKQRKILISNSLKEFIIPILKHLKLKKYFSEIYCADDFDNKADFIKSYLRKNKINPKNCYYIGDRVADVKVANKVRCKSVIITGKCSWDSKKELLKAGPDFVVDNIKEIVYVII